MPKLWDFAGAWGENSKARKEDDKHDILKAYGYNSNSYYIIKKGTKQTRFLCTFPFFHPISCPHSSVFQAAHAIQLFLVPLLWASTWVLVPIWRVFILAADVGEAIRHSIFRNEHERKAIRKRSSSFHLSLLEAMVSHKVLLWIFP